MSKNTDINVSKGYQINHTVPRIHIMKTRSHVWKWADLILEDNLK